MTTRIGKLLSSKQALSEVTESSKFGDWPDNFKKADAPFNKIKQGDTLVFNKDEETGYTPEGIAVFMSVNNHILIKPKTKAPGSLHRDLVSMDDDKLYLIPGWELVKVNGKPFK